MIITLGTHSRALFTKLGKLHTYAEHTYAVSGLFRNGASRLPGSRNTGKFYYHSSGEARFKCLPWMPRRQTA